MTSGPNRDLVVVCQRVEDYWVVCLHDTQTSQLLELARGATGPMARTEALRALLDSAKFTLDTGAGVIAIEPRPKKFVSPWFEFYDYDSQPQAIRLDEVSTYRLPSGRPNDHGDVHIRTGQRFGFGPGSAAERLKKALVEWAQQ